MKRCSAHSKRTGERCKKPPIRGATVCRAHGGGAPQVKASAEERLRALGGPALDALERALKAKDATKATRAALGLLDRAGIRVDVVPAAEYDKLLRKFVECGAGMTNLFMSHVADDWTRRQIFGELTALLGKLDPETAAMLALPPAPPVDEDEEIVV